MAVVRDGVVEVDDAGGTRDGSVPWTSDTLVMSFSVAKPFAALACLDVVAQGAFGLDTTVASVWPAYGGHGKQDTTVRHLLAHQAGLPASRRPRWTWPSTTARPWSACSRRPPPSIARSRRRRARADLRPPARRGGASRLGHCPRRALRGPGPPGGLGPAPARRAARPRTRGDPRRADRRVGGRLPLRPALGDRRWAVRPACSTRTR